MIYTISRGKGFPKEGEDKLVEGNPHETMVNENMNPLVRSNSTTFLIGKCSPQNPPRLQIFALGNLPGSCIFPWWSQTTAATPHTFSGSYVTSSKGITQPDYSLELFTRDKLWWGERERSHTYGEMEINKLNRTKNSLAVLGWTQTSGKV